MDRRDRFSLIASSCEDGRELSALFYETAQAFLLDLQDGTVSSTTAGVDNAAHAVELALKSYLLHKGFPDEHIGPDLEKALALANDAGLDHAPEDLRWLLTLLSRYHMAGLGRRTLPLSRAVEALFTLPEMAGIVERLIDRVGQATGHGQPAPGPEAANDQA